MSRSVVLTSSEEFIALRNFMIAEGGLGLSGVKALVYALVYQHSPADALQNDSGCYFGSIDYTAARTGASRRSVINAFHELLVEGLIMETGNYVQGNNLTTKKYIVNRRRAERARTDFANYWLHADTQVDSGEETSPDNAFESSGAISAPEGPCDGSGANSAPDGQFDSPSSGAMEASRAETAPEGPCDDSDAVSAPEDTGSGAIPARDQVQKLHPNRHSERQGLDLSTNNSPSPSNPPKPERAVRADGSEEQKTSAEVGASASVAGLDDEAAEAVKALMRRSLNQNASFSEVARAYLEALSDGYTPEQIGQGYEAYVRRYRKENPGTTAYAMRLSNYLRRGDGLRFDEPVSQREKDAKARRKRRQEALLYDRELRRFYEAIPTQDDVNCGRATQAEREAAIAAYEDYFDFSEGKAGTAYERRLIEVLYSNAPSGIERKEASHG